MAQRIIATAGLVILLGLAGAAQAPSAMRTPWGDPDLQGVFTSDDELGVPFERPEQFGTRQTMTDQEFAEREAQARRQAATDAEEFVRPGRGVGLDGTGPPPHWLERGRPSRRTSLVIDPPDGRVPFLNDAARKRAAVAVNARTTGNKPFDGPDALDLYDRCITRGLPHVIFPTIYNNTSQIVQGPGYVAIRYEMIHDARVIPLDGRAPLARHPPDLRRLARALGGRYPRGRGDQLPGDDDQLPGRRRGPEAGRTLPPRRRADRALRSDGDRRLHVLTTVDGGHQPAGSTGYTRRLRVRLSRRQLRDAQHPERCARR
jgi:hypothetical protein